MNHDEIIQGILDYIESNLKEKLSLSLIASKAGYSDYHFSRMFSMLAKMPVMTYVAQRRLTHAMYDLARGARVTETAMEYTFETHAGFTKAFKRRFGFPPSLCFGRIAPDQPARPSLVRLGQMITGGTHMHPHIFEPTPFSIIGFPQEVTLPNAKHTRDIPTYWDSIDLDFGALLEKLYEQFPHSKHNEISVCFQKEEIPDKVFYMLGRGIHDSRDFANIKPDMARIDVSGLYAVFSTPPVEGDYAKTAKETWNQIFTDWLPKSEFEFDDSRYDFEYHDHRDHGWYFGGKLQIDIYIPIRQKEDAKLKAQQGPDYIG